MSHVVTLTKMIVILLFCIDILIVYAQVTERLELRHANRLLAKSWPHFTP